MISISAGSTTPASSPRLGGLRRPLGHALVLAKRPVDDGLEHVAEVRVARAVPVYEAGPRDVLEIVGHDASNQNPAYRSDSRRSEVKVTNSSGEQCPQRAADLLGHGRLRVLLVPLQPLQRRAAQKQRPLGRASASVPFEPGLLDHHRQGPSKVENPPTGFGQQTCFAVCRRRGARHGQAAAGYPTCSS